MAKRQLVIVSNRLPITASKVDGKLVYTPSTGGLATAMTSMEGDASSRLWIGWPGIASDDLTPGEKSAITRKFKQEGCYPVFLTKKQIDMFYSGYANDTIWPLFHYFQSYAHYDTAYWDAYKVVNRMFQKAITRQADPKSSIWIHDYHLMLLPNMVRQALPLTTIGFFLHIPFPSYEIFRLLPNRGEVLKGLMGADLVGFHTYDYARHFLSSVRRILGLDSKHGSIIMGDRVIKVDAFPIGIDYKYYAAIARDAETLEKAATFREHHKGKKVIVSAGDRLDYSKGIIKKLEAFEQFLRQYPAYHKKVVLVMQVAPSRMDVDTYRDLRDQIEKAIARINGTLGTADWAPISYQFKSLTVDQILPMFMASEVGLVTPLRDGMNIVAKEYIAVKQKTPGVLILSEMAGAIDEFPEALSINPNDIDSIVKALNTALTMPKKTQITSLKSMQRRLSRYTVQRWAKDFMEQLEGTKLTQAEQGSKLFTADRETRLLRHFATAKKRLLLLDYDGTLRGFASGHQPSQAAPPKSLMTLLRNLTELPNTKVCIISGRPRKALTTWFYGLPVSLAAEHGAWMKYNGEWSQQPVSLHEHKKTIMPVLEHYADRTPGAEIEQKDFALVWHYRNVPTELAHARNASLSYELNQLLINTDLTIHRGNKIIEIKPRSVHKGAVAEDLMAIHKADFVLAIGDDYTDEDMFRSLPEDAYSIKVGLGETSARYQLVTIQNVHQLLKKLTQSITN